MIVKKKNVVNDLIKAAKSADQILLASDPDREGEAISWHVKWILENDKGLISNSKKKKSSLNITRVTFHEITKEAVE